MTYPYYPYYPRTTVNTTVVNQGAKKTRRTIAPQVKVTVDDINSMFVQNGRVCINFENHELELDSQYSYEEIEAAVEGRCYYRDKLGVPTCVLHDAETEYDISRGEFRRCVQNDHDVQAARVELEILRAMYPRFSDKKEDLELELELEEPARKRRSWFGKN